MSAQEEAQRKRRAELAEGLASKALTAQALMERPPPEWLVDEWLPQGAVAVLYSPGGVGKTFLALDLGCSVGMGLHWQAKEVRRGPVLYVAAEGTAGLGKRLAAWEQEMLAEGDRLEDLTVLPVRVNMLEEPERAALVGFCEWLRPALVVVDTVNRSIPGGDENGSRDLGLVVDCADAIRKAVDGCTVLLLHHVTKGGVLRGHSSLADNVDTVLRLAEDSGTPGLLTLTSEKQKDAADPPAMDFRREQVKVILPGGRVETSCVLRGLGRSRKLSETFELAEPTVRAIGRLLRDLFETQAGATATQWQAVAEERGHNRSTFFKAKKALIEGGFVAGDPGKRGARFTVTEAGGGWLAHE